MNASFHEKSLWLLLTGLIVTFGWYFASVLPQRAANVAPHQVVLLVVMVALLIIFQIVGHTVLAVAARRELLSSAVQSDERDKMIALKGTRNGSYVLGTGVFFSLVAAVVTTGNFTFVHVLLGAWVAAQAVEILSQIVLYRRSA